MKNVDLKWLKNKLNLKQTIICFFILLICTSYTYSQSDNEIVGKKSGNKWGFVDAKGTPLTPFIFDDIHRANICEYQPKIWNAKKMRWFYKELAVVEKDGQFAVLNKKMEYIVPFNTYQWISPMSIGGLMIVKQNNKYGLLNHQLKISQNIEFDTISNAPVQFYEQEYPSFWAKKNDKYYIFDTLGNWSDHIEYDDIKLLQANFFLVRKDGKSWRIDRNGTKIIEDFVVVRDDENGFIARKDSLFGLINIYGGEVLPFEYEDIISEHLGNIFVKKYGKWGSVNKENKQLLPFKYDYISYACDGSGKDSGNYIVVQNDKFGKASINGTEIFPCLYDGITTWVEYVDYGHYVMVGNKMGLIDYNGNILMPALYEDFDYLFDLKCAIVFDKGKAGLFNITNNSIILPIEFDSLSIVTSDTAKSFKIVTYKDDVINLLDERGKIIQSKVSKAELKEKIDIDITFSRNSICTYQLLCMIHNRTFMPPPCLLKMLKNDKPVESIYYKMGANE